MKELLPISNPITEVKVIVIKISIDFKSIIFIPISLLMIVINNKNSDEEIVARFNCLSLRTVKRSIKIKNIPKEL